MVCPVNYASLTGYLGEIDYQDDAPPAMVPRLTSFMNLRIFVFSR